MCRAHLGQRPTGRFGWPAMPVPSLRQRGPEDSQAGWVDQQHLVGLHRRYRRGTHTKTPPAAWGMVAAANTTRGATAGSATGPSCGSTERRIRSSSTDKIRIMAEIGEEDDHERTAVPQRNGPRSPPVTAPTTGMSSKSVEDDDADEGNVERGNNRIYGDWPTRACRRRT
jgi:hypothetical protein